MEREYRNMGRNRRRACCLVIILLLSGICGAVNDKKFGGDVILTGDEAMLWFYNGVYYIRFRASGSLAGNYDFVWPTDDGATGQQLTTNGSGVLSWVDPGGAGGAGDISDVWNVTNGNANALTAASGDSLDATNADSTIPWEVDTTAAPTEEGRSVWDSDNDILTIGDGIGTDYVAYGASDGDALSGDSATSFFDTGEIEVVYGGTGAATLTDGGVLLGSGTGAITPMAVLADGEFIVGDGTTDPVAESGNTARTSLGLGTGDSPTFAGGTFNGDVLFDGNDDKDALWDQGNGRFWLEDFVRIYFGGYGSIRYDSGENSGEMVFSTGSGKVKAFTGGPSRFDAAIYFTQTDGNEYIDSLADGYMDYGATTAHRFNNNVDITGTINTTSDDNWDLNDYTAGAPTCTGYVTVTINGTAYKLLARLEP